MAFETRGQGRPPRGEGEVGRARLLDRTRDALKTKPRVDMQRREIAISAGVTPALVSYYYRDKWDLFAAAAKPVIEDFVASVRAVIQPEMPPRQKVLLLASLYIEFNFRQGYLLDFCKENMEKMSIDSSLICLKQAEIETISLFETLMNDGLLKGESPIFIQTSMWGLCKHLGQKWLVLTDLTDADQAQVFKSLAEDVCDLFINIASPFANFDSDSQETRQDIGSILPIRYEGTVCV